ncbi:MAG: hypothetical protein HY913_04475 [Desulfomonile tiedjei]|nr:hypothetical protein [Desulfomonile tiedjei]
MKADIFAVVGCPPHKWGDGTPQWNDPAQEPSLEVKSALVALDWSSNPDGDAAFLQIDLESDETALAAKSVLTQAQWQALKDYQVARIRECRAAEYSKKFDGMAQGVRWDGDQEGPALAERVRVKSLYPYPGNYR